MSACISMHGEFGSHELTGKDADRFICQRCGVLDEDGIMNALDAAEARVRALTEPIAGLFISRNGYGDDTLWRAIDDRPVALIRECECPPEVWALITAALAGVTP